MGKKTTSSGLPANCTLCGQRFNNPGVVSRRMKANRIRICPPCIKNLKAEKQRKKLENS